MKPNVQQLLMKTLMFTLISMCFTHAASAQTVTCTSLHEGMFKVTDQATGVTLITRTKKYQTEENDFLGYKVVFNITWTDDCTYELRPKEVIKGDPSIMGNGKNVLITHIKQVTDKSYIAECSSNFFNGTTDFEVDIMN